MKNSFKTLLQSFSLLLFLSGCYKTTESEQFIKSEPLQYEIYPDEVILDQNFTAKLHHYYELEATVLMKKSYKNEWDGHIQPYDFVLAWKDMTDNNFLKKIKIKQSGRWYYYKWEENGIDFKRVGHNSSNTHMIPANEDIRDILDDIDEGESYYFEGYLTDLNYQDQYNDILLKSSIRRDDTGDGACERFYVTKIEEL